MRGSRRRPAEGRKISAHPSPFQSSRGSSPCGSSPRACESPPGTWQSSSGADWRRAVAVVSTDMGEAYREELKFPPETAVGSDSALFGEYVSEPRCGDEGIPGDVRSCRWPDFHPLPGNGRFPTGPGRGFPPTLRREIRESGSPENSGSRAKDWCFTCRCDETENRASSSTWLANPRQPERRRSPSAVPDPSGAS
jgi:hypothetical protein